MTTPGGTNVGTAYGKVRIEYESKGVAQSSKDLGALEQSLADVGKSAGVSAKEVARAQGQIISSAQAAQKVLEKGLTVSAPLTIVPKQVSLDHGAITKAVNAFKPNQRESIQIATGVRLYPSDVKIDQGAITRSLAALGKSSSQKITVTAAIKVDPTDVSIDSVALQERLKVGNLTISAPIHIEPSDVTINRNALQQRANAGGPINMGGQSGGGGGGGFGAGALAGGLLKGGAKFAGPLALAGGAIAGLSALGGVITAGFSRLESIDQATIKLKALGKSEQEIANISKVSLATVKDTAFGLDESFSAATNAIAAGIKPGQQLENYMSALASTAALANTSMTDLGQSFSEAAVQGKLTGDIMQMLYSRQVPVLQLLADEYGVTQQKAQEMVSNGQVDFEHFIEAMNKNSQAAKMMGNTVSGSFQNLMASVKRVGAALLAPLFAKDAEGASTLARLIQSLTNDLKTFEGFLEQNKGAIIDFWVDGGKAAVGAGHLILDVVSWIVRGTGEIVKAVSYIPRALGALEDLIPGRNGDQYRADADAVKGLGDELTDASKTMSVWHGQLDDTYKSLTTWGQKVKDTKALTGELVPENAVKQTISLADALEKIGVKADSANEALAGTNDQYRKFIDQVKEKGGTQDLIDTLDKVRYQFENGGKQVKDFAEAIQDFGDKTESADSRAQRFIETLRNLGKLPDDQALSRYNQDVEDAIGYQSNLVDALDATGGALVQNNGRLNLNYKNARTLSDQFSKIIQDSTAVVASGAASPEEAYSHTSDVLKKLLTQFGIADAGLQQQVIDTYFPRDAFEKAIKEGDPKKAIEDIFKDDPAQLQTELNLLTTTDDLLKNIVGPDGNLHVPTVLDQGGQTGPKTGWWTNGTPGSPNAPFGPGGSGGVGGGANPQTTTVPLPMPNIPPPAPPRTAPGEGHFPGQNIPKDQGTPWWKYLIPGFLPGSADWIPEDPMKGVSDDQVKQLLQQNPDIEKILHDRVTNAESQGQSLSDAFAQGIEDGSPDVKAAIERLAQLAADGLGHSPAKYGPLSGSGWTYNRGQTLTQDWAKGIVSESGSVKSSVTGIATSATQGVEALTFDQQLDRFMKDLQDISDFGKLALDFGKQIGDIAFSVANLANTFSGGKLFPKTYTQDPLFDKRRGNPLGAFNPLGWNPAGRAGTPGAPGGGGTVPLTQNPDGTWTSSDPTWAKLIARESGGVNKKQNPSTVDSNTGGNEAEGIFQITPDTWKKNGGLAFAPNPLAASPEDQAKVAANILGSDPGAWGFYRHPGREDPAALRAGLVGGGVPNVGGPAGITSMPSPNHGGAITPNKFLVHTEEGNSPSARALAQGMEGGGKSYNYLVDPNTGEVIQAVPAGTAAYSVGSPGNQSSINAVVAGSTVNWSKQQWLEHGSALSSLASLAAQNAAQFNIPLEQLGPGSTAGIGGHDWVSQNLGGTDHTDPGPNFPWPEFMSMVRGFASGAMPSTPQTAQTAGGFGTYAGDEALLSRVPKGRYDSTAKDLQKGLADCSSSVEDLVNMMDGLPTEGGRLTTMNAIDELTKRGFLPTDMPVPGAFNIGFNAGHMQATLPGGTNFNWGSNEAAALGGRTGGGAFEQGLTSHFYRPVGAGGAQGLSAGNAAVEVRDQNGNLLGTVPAGTANATEFRDQNGNLLTTVQPTIGNGAPPSNLAPFGTNPWTSASGNTALDQLIQSDPLLSGALGNRGALTSDSAVEVLQHIDGLISDQNKIVEENSGMPKLGIMPTDEQRQTAIDAKARADALGNIKSGIQSQFGLTEGQSQLEQAQGVFQGIAGIASSALETFDAGIKYIGAWKDVGDTLVRGIANTGDVMKLIDDWQVGLDFWNKVVQTGSQIASFAGSLTGGADMGITSGIGGMLGLVSQVMTAINTGIDLWQKGYEITTKYVGRFLTSWFGMPGASDVKFLLDEMTGQLQIYSSDNPQMKHTFNTLGRELGNTYPGRPSPTNQFVINQGPGQDPRDTMDDAMYTVRASGVGAFGYAD